MKIATHRLKQNIAFLCFGLLVPVSVSAQQTNNAANLTNSAAPSASSVTTGGTNINYQTNNAYNNEMGFGPGVFCRTPTLYVGGNIGHVKQDNFESELKNRMIQKFEKDSKFLELKSVFKKEVWDEKITPERAAEDILKTVEKLDKIKQFKRDYSPMALQDKVSKVINKYNCGKFISCCHVLRGHFRLKKWRSRVKYPLSVTLSIDHAAQDWPRRCALVLKKLLDKTPSIKHKTQKVRK